MEIYVFRANSGDNFKPVIASRAFQSNEEAQQECNKHYLEMLEQMEQNETNVQPYHFSIGEKEDY